MCRINLPCGILLKYPFRDLHASPLVICNMFSHLSSDGTGQSGWCLPAAFQFHYNLMCQSEFSGETFRDVVTSPKTQKSVCIFAKAGTTFNWNLWAGVRRVCEQVRLWTYTQLTTRKGRKMRLFVVFVLLFIRPLTSTWEQEARRQTQNLQDVSEQSVFVSPLQKALQFH